MCMIRKLLHNKYVGWHGEKKVDDSRLFEHDGLPTPEVGNWAITKHAKLKYYQTLFARSMRAKWDCRVYVDLFCCAGKCIVKKTGQVVPGSPLIALSVEDPFDKHVFVEENPEYMEALRKRVHRYFPAADCAFVLGNCNERIEDILDSVPRFHRGYRGLTLCFVDPFRSGQLEFQTLRIVAESLYVDFLVLIPSYMDINRNERNYCRLSNHSLDRFLGTSEWRRAWSDNGTPYQRFGVFVADQFGRQMKKLGYIYEDPSEMELVRMDSGQNLPLYHLAFFSRNDLGVKFWRETVRRTTDQLTLNLGED